MLSLQLTQPTAVGTFTINQTNNTFNDVTFTATFTDDNGISNSLSNVSYDTPTTTLTVEGLHEVMSTEVFTDEFTLHREYSSSGLGFVGGRRMETNYYISR